MSDDTVNRRDRKRLATRSAIRIAALELFMDRDFDGVSVEEVADAADVSPSTVYRHFETKEALVLSHLADRQGDFLDAIDRRPRSENIGAVLIGATIDWAPAVTDQRWLRTEVALIVATPALLARMHQMIAAWEGPIAARLAVRCGRSPLDLDLLQLTALFCATIRIVIREWASADSETDVVTFGLGALDALLHLPASELPDTPSPERDR